MAKSNSSSTEQGSLLEKTTSTAAPAPSPSALLANLAPQIEALDKFAEENNLAVLTEGKGSFTAALSVADAIGRLKVMLTPEIMQPIMALQGTALGFKTDMDKEGGYKVDVVRDCFIEATLKGFKMVGNQANIIAGRFYATKEGFEDFFLRQAKAGKFTDYRDAYSTPKIVSESEAIVNASATWVWQGKPDKMENVPISIRVNKGQGADAILGKAKRKLKARIYERVTGTVITEGDANEATTIDVETRKVAEQGAAPAQAAGAAGATPEQKQLLTELVKENDAEAQANAWLKQQNAIPADGTYLDVRASLATKILGKPKDFISAVKASSPTTTNKPAAG